MDPSELRALLERHHRASFGWALSCVGRDPDEAETVLQTAYLKILEGRARFDGKATFKTWLFAVIRRTAADRIRRRILERLRLARFEASVRRHTPRQTADESVHRAQLQALFQRALAALSKRQREVLHLVFYHDLSVAEAAAVLELSVGSARTHYERGKARLRVWLQASGAFDESGLDR